MRIDANTAAIQLLAGTPEPWHASPFPTQPQTTPDTVNLSALASGAELDELATSYAAGLITGNANGALSAHGRLDPERAMRLAGLLE